MCRHQVITLFTAPFVNRLALSVFLALVPGDSFGDILSLRDYLRNDFRYDFPTGIPHGTWDFDEWPGIDHDKTYRVGYPFPGSDHMKIDFVKTHFDRDDHLGYLMPPELLDSQGLEDIEDFIERSFGSKTAGEVTIMTITAHPDDETIDLGGILGWGSQQGYRTVAVSVTSGSNSRALEVEEVPGSFTYNGFGIDTGGAFRVERDRYGEERRASFQQGCRILGVTKGYFLPYPGESLFGKKVSGFGEVSGIDYDRTFGPRGRFRADLKNAIVRAVAEEGPDLLFTHGTDGGYGHPMHLIVDRLVTEIVQESGSAIYLFYSTPEMNASDRITHYLDLRADGVDLQSRKGEAFKAHGYIAKPQSNFDFPWDPVWNPEGPLMKDYGWTPKGYPPPYEFYSLQKIGNRPADLR